MSSPLRVGRIVALNMYPVYHHLETGAGRDLIFTDGLPTTLNRALLAGELDVSAMSSIEYARHADELELLPVASISAAGAVDSIQVFSNVPFDEIRTVAVTPHSATSVALLRVLTGSHVTRSLLETSPSESLRQVDGVLLIADEALAGLRSGLGAHRTDLGERWRAMTGLPMVFAVWAARRGALSADQLSGLETLLREARQRFNEEPAPVVEAAVLRFAFPSDYIDGYFARLEYGFGDSERAGLERFLHLARDAGELATVPTLPASSPPDA